MKYPVRLPNHNLAVDGTNGNGSLLKLLREKKKVSRTEVSRLTQLSTYQVEGLEGRGSQSHLAKIFLYIKALGYKVEDVFNLIESSLHQKEGKLQRGVLGSPLHEIEFERGVKLSTCVETNGTCFGQLQLAAGKTLMRRSLPMGDAILIVVQEGTLIFDALTKETVYKKNHFLVLPGNLPAELSNGDSFVQLSALLFCINSPIQTNGL